MWEWVFPDPSEVNSNSDQRSESVDGATSSWHQHWQNSRSCFHSWWTIRAVGRSWWCFVLSRGRQKWNSWEHEARIEEQSSWISKCVASGKNARESRTWEVKIKPDSRSWQRCGESRTAAQHSGGQVTNGTRQPTEWSEHTKIKNESEGSVVETRFHQTAGTEFRTALTSPSSWWLLRGRLRILRRSSIKTPRTNRRGRKRSRLATRMASRSSPKIRRYLLQLFDV